MSGSPRSNEKSTLHTEPSFCIYNTDDKVVEEADGEDMIINVSKLERYLTSEERIETQFSFVRNAMQMIKEDDYNENDDVVGNKCRSPSRFEDLKIELGDGSTTGDVGNEANCSGGGDAGFGDRRSNVSGDYEDYYNAMIRQNPSNPLVLRNFGQYLESKGDIFGAEEYYFHATLADPKDGEILSRYAKLVWELHRDHKRALPYFERAVQAAPEDSRVHAAYASFLWEIDEDEEEDNSFDAQAANADNWTMKSEEEKRPASPPLHLALGLGVGMIGYGSDTADVNEFSTVEEYYRKTVEENPCNPLFLRNYAHFLHQSKGEFREAENYYSRAILLDPCNGQLLSLYANLVWQLHGDKDRAVSYFERAVQASPKDSDVLGSYAKFLWEVEDEEDDVTSEDCNQMHLQ